MVNKLPDIRESTLSNSQRKKGMKKMNNPQRNNTPTYNRPPQNGTKRPPASAPKRKQKMRFKPNKEGMLSLAILLLIAIIAITSIVLIVKGIANAINQNENASETSTTDNTPETPEDQWNAGFTNLSVPTSDVAVGDLILVNFENEYALTDTLSSKLTPLYTSTGYGSYYFLSGSDLKVRTDIKKPLQDMIFALVDANPETLGNVSGEDRIIITSGYRTLDLYNKRTEERYVAVPGHSEHHTGYAVDIQVYTNNQKTVLLRDTEQAWMEAHCAEFGFVVRYDGSKYELTGILDEPWHYRYVGIPHATYLMESGLCMEEYLQTLREKHSYDKEPLEITAGEKDYLVYYISASADSTTFIPVPPESFGQYTISGDNLNGFIVTIEKAK